MIPPNDVLAQLPLLSWRGLDAPPYDMVGFSWQNELAPRGIPYVDVDVHDAVRRKSAEFKVRLYFCEVLSEGAFTILWPEWLQAIKTGDPDYLVHPLLGTVRARVSNVGGEVTAKIRDGVVVEVSFVETNEDPATASADLTSSFSIESMAKLADDNSGIVGVGYPDGSFGTSIFDAWDKIKGAVFSIGLTVFGTIGTLIANVEKMIADVEALDSHEAWPALDALIHVWSALYQQKQAFAAAARPTATKKTAALTSLDEFARSVGNTFQDVLGLNIQAAQTPLVPKNTILTYYTAA